MVAALEFEVVEILEVESCFEEVSPRGARRWAVLMVAVFYDFGFHNK